MYSDFQYFDPTYDLLFGEFTLVEKITTVPLTWILRNEIFFKAQNAFYVPIAKYLCAVVRT